MTGQSYKKYIHYYWYERTIAGAYLFQGAYRNLSLLFTEKCP
jgi:hypothetical protein